MSLSLDFLSAPCRQEMVSKNAMGHCSLFGPLLCKRFPLLPCRMWKKGHCQHLSVAQSKHWYNCCGLVNASASYDNWQPVRCLFFWWWFLFGGRRGRRGTSKLNPRYMWQFSKNGFGVSIIRILHSSSAKGKAFCTDRGIDVSIHI